MHRILYALVLSACTAESPVGARVVHVAMTVDELEPALAWFESSVDARRGPTDAWTGGIAQAIHIGAQRVVLLDADVDAPSSPPATSNDPSFQHLALVVGDIEARWATIAGNVTPTSIAPQRIPDDNVAAAGIRAVYFRGPGDHALELIDYPPDKGAAQWHVDTDTVLGIDHTAIVVADTERSLAFYRDLLGLHVAGTSLNSGVEQERLSGVAGARVRITGLRGASGMGVELLEYEAPGLVESTSAAVETPSTRTTIEVDDLGATIERLRAADVTLLSRSTSACIGCAVPSAAFDVADPDGHVVQLVQPRP
jgi:catechol 2,3-dioxygenase-like lactoylglutathione lyase family enzyme